MTIASWPAWYYGPDGQSQIFQSEEEIPDGWEDHPKKVGDVRQRREPVPPQESPYKDKTDAEVIAELKLRDIEHGARWPRQRLEKLLLDDDAKKGN